jgi:ribonuclease Z
MSANFAVDAAAERRSYPPFYFPGEELAADEMRVFVLGSGGPFVTPHQAAPCIMVEVGDGRLFIFDFGGGAFARLNTLLIPPNRVDKVFISHLHVDHWAGLPHLYAMGMIFGREDPLSLFGPSALTPDLGMKQWGEHFMGTMKWDIASRIGKSSGSFSSGMNVHEFSYADPDWIFDENDVRVKAFPAVHCIDGAVSYRLEWNDLSFVFSGDTKPNQFFVDHGQDADLVVHECFPPAEVHSAQSGLPLEFSRKIVNGVHSPPRAVGGVFTLTKPRLPVIYHLRANQEELVPVLEDLRVNWGGPVVIARDMMVFNISKTQITQRMAITPDLPVPVVPQRMKSSQDGAIQKAQEAQEMSSWLRDAAIRIEGVDYEGTDKF